MGEAPGNIVLVGYRGAGKSAVGRKLAEALHRPFADTDALIEQRAGCSIKEIFEQQGEPAFRAMEIQVVGNVVGEKEQVIACGGGVVLNPLNIRALRRSGKVVWLRASPEELFRRIQADAAGAARRPNLTAAGGLDEVRRLLEIRTPLYQTAAHFVVDTEGVGLDGIVADVRRAVGL